MPQSDQTPTGGGRTGLIVVSVIAALCLVAAIVATGLWVSERNAAASVRADRASAAELDASYRLLSFLKALVKFPLLQIQIPHIIDRL